MAKIFFVLQLLVAWIIVVLSTLYATWDSQRECDSGDWLRVSDSFTIDALGVIVFVLTIVAPFLFSLETYINAKARQPAQEPWRGSRTPRQPDAPAVHMLQTPPLARVRLCRCVGDS